MNATELQSLIAQTYLKQKGYYTGELDGRYGPVSKRAGAAWFLENNKKAAKINATAENIRALAAQTLLADLKYYTGELDGKFGPLSRAAANQWAARNTGTPAPYEPQVKAPIHSPLIPYDVAEGYLGTREIPGKEHNPIIVRWHRRLLSWISDDETAWCSSFANFCAAEAGYEQSGKVNARSWLTVGEPIDLKDARKGDVIILWRGTKTSWEGHVAFLDHYNPQRGLLYLLGGNQNNEVNITAYPVGKLLGVRRLRTLERLQGPSNKI